jgi:hypothetical protein
MSDVRTDRPRSLAFRLLIGVVLVGALLAAALAEPPEGPLGTLLARNEAEGIEAGALFYRDLDRIDEIQADLRVMRQEARERAASRH